MEIALDREGDVPLAVQLAWALRARILAGELDRGDRLPGVRDLAVATGVNVNTVRAVYARLEAEGLIAAEHGRGTFVSRDAPSDERLADVARRAREAAQAAGLDPREVAAALYSGPAATPPADGDAAERRQLRDQIARLERALADEHLVARIRQPREDVVEPARPADGRMLGVAELRAIRDDLAGRLQLLVEADADRPAAAAPAPASTARASSTTRAPGVRSVRWTPSFGR